MFVLGTAGHIDHGKSALVLALTGMDPDRLREEKERGMTIDLGFAWLALPSGREVGIVDVPGHERLIKNMLAGVGGIDLAMLIVAANEGVMPQTKEHMAILDLLQVSRGVVVITKKDLVDDEWLGVVKLEVEELLAPTSLAGAPILAVSSITREGLPELVAAIDGLLGSIEHRKDIGRPRLPIDRVFTIAGAGTVVTGTLMDGCFTVGQEVEIMPSGLKSRIRGLQTHKSKIETATPGSRVGTNLVGVATEQLQRGDVLTRPGWLKPTTMVTVQLRLLPHLQRPIAHNAEVTFYTGTTETMAKVRLLDKDELKPGETAWAQLVLDRTAAIVIGDYFIIRSPMETMGGGRIYESHTKRHHRYRAEILRSLAVKEKGTSEEVIVALLDARSPLELSALVAQSNLPEADVKAGIESLVQQGRVVLVSEGKSNLYFSAAGWDALARKTAVILREYHQKYPARPGMARVEMGSRLKMGEKYPAILQRLAKEGTIAGDGGIIHLPEYQVKLNPAQQAKVDAFLKELTKNPYAPNSELIPEADLLNLLIFQNRVVKISDDVVFGASVYDDMVQKIVAHIKKSGKATVGEVRDMFGTSRKYVLALLEHLDRTKVTKRVGDERVLV